MTREEAKHWLEIELKTWEDECKSKHPIKEALSVAIKVLEQEPVLDKISAEIEDLYSYADFDEGTMTCYNMVRLEEVQRVINKYKAESENA